MSALPRQHSQRLRHGLSHRTATFWSLVDEHPLCQGMSVLDRYVSDRGSHDVLHPAPGRTSRRCRPATGFCAARSRVRTRPGCELRYAVAILNHSSGSTEFSYSGRGYSYGRVSWVKVDVEMYYSQTGTAPWLLWSEQTHTCKPATAGGGCSMRTYYSSTAICGGGWYRNITHSSASNKAHDSDTKTVYVPGGPVPASTPGSVHAMICTEPF